MISIIGGGISGVSCAYFLKKLGVESEIYESGPELGSGASGNKQALINPVISGTKRSAEMEWISEEAWAHYKELGFHPSGSIHLPTNDKVKRLKKTHPDLFISGAEASDLVGLEIPYDSVVYYKNGGFIDTKEVLTKLSKGIKIHFNAKASPKGTVIWCSGNPMFNLPLELVRGEVSFISPPGIMIPIAYGGYVLPGGVVGSSFDHGLFDPNLTRQAFILEKLKATLKISPNHLGGRVSYRLNTPDRLPLVGTISKDVLVSLGHGSRGFQTALVAGRVLAEFLVNGKAIPASLNVSRYR